MKFCPTCDIRLKKGDSGLSCSKCGYTESAEIKAPKKVLEPEDPSEITVLDENDQKANQSTIKIDCPKCDHGEAVWWMLQTRSADEATTQFFRCTKCRHTWRNYD